MALCSRCHKEFPDDPNHPGYPDLHQCEPSAPEQFSIEEISRAVYLASTVDPMTLSGADRQLYVATIEKCKTVVVQEGDNVTMKTFSLVSVRGT